MQAQLAFGVKEALRASAPQRERTNRVLSANVNVINRYSITKYTYHECLDWLRDLGQERPRSEARKGAGGASATRASLIGSLDTYTVKIPASVKTWKGLFSGKY